MRIVVMCGAGASSTFIALRLRKAAAARNLDVSATAAPIETLEISLDEADVLLLGPHLDERSDAIRTIAADRAVPVAVLPASVFSSPTGDDALDLALDARGGRS